MSADLTDSIKALALEMGFPRVGISPAGEVAHSERLSAWLGSCRHGGMKYMAGNVDLRLNPSRLVPGAKSVICLGVSYGGGYSFGQGVIARYACGRDYHKILKRQCVRLMDAIRIRHEAFEGRAFVDSAPVMERSLAALAGLGWIGCNGCLIVPGMGSYVLLCEIVCNLPLRIGSPLEGSCGRCGKCVKACPTGALLEDGSVDADRCISYLTIEHRGEIPAQYWPLMGTRVFGCDACQEVCPHNQCGQAGPPRESQGLDLAQVLLWRHADWDAATRGRAIRRATLPMFLRNAAIAAGNSGDENLAGPLAELLARADGDLTPLRPAIKWAISRLAGNNLS